MTINVSVVMAVHNGEQFLQSALDSILSQTLDNIEFIVVDDGSVDSTPSILHSAKYQGVSVLRLQQNEGIGSALNAGISKASGEYIARQDADDISSPERLLIQAKYLDSHPSVAVVGTAAQWIDRDGGVIRTWPEGLTNSEIQQRLLYTCPLIHGSTMFRRETFEEIGGYDAQLRTAQDYDLWLRIAERWNIVSIPDVIYSYRWHDAMVSKTAKSEQDENATSARSHAIKRRLKELQRLIGGGDSKLSFPSHPKSREEIARLYLWWSAGARSYSKIAALLFLAGAFLLKPNNPQAWKYSAEILRRKRSLVKTKIGLSEKIESRAT